MSIDPDQIARLQAQIDAGREGLSARTAPPPPQAWDELVAAVLALRSGRVEPPPPARIEWGQDAGVITATVTRCPDCCDTGSVPTEADGCGYTSVVDCTCALLRRTARVVTRARVPTVPPRATLATYEVERPGDTPDTVALRRAALDAARAFAAGRASGLALLGPPGAGKTHLLVAIGRALVARSRPVRYATWGDVVQSLRAHIGDRAAHPDPLPPLIRVPVLLLDEVGAGRGTDWQAETAEALIAGRADRGLPTALASNCGPRPRGGLPALEDRIGPRAWDRVVRTCTVVTMPDGSQR